MTYKSILWELFARIGHNLEVSTMKFNTRNVVLNYHSVSPKKTELFGNISPERFRQTLKFLTTHFEIVDLPRVVSNESNKKQVALTFDDGYENVYTNAVPILEEFDVPATTFINPSFIGDANRNQILDVHGYTDPPSRIIMDCPQLSELASSSLITIGNHTATHPDLSTLDKSKELKQEVIGAKESLEDKFGITVNRFSYPYGRYSSDAIDMVSQSHDYAVGTRYGLVASDTVSHRLPRISGHKPRYMVDWELTDVSHKIKDIYYSLHSK